MRMWLLTVVVAVSFCVALPAASESKRAEITDWMALGSGCKGNSRNEGDVHMLVTHDPKDLQRLEVSFDMGSYGLSGAKPIQKENQSFARECALRFAISPLPNTKIKSVELATDFIIGKDKGARAEFHSRLLTPSGTIAEWEKVFSIEEVLNNSKHNLELVPDAKGKDILEHLSCGDARILGADFTMENYRKSFKEKVEMKHGDSNKVRFIVQLEHCSQSYAKTKKI